MYKSRAVFLFLACIALIAVSVAQMNARSTGAANMAAVEGVFNAVQRGAVDELGNYIAVNIVNNKMTSSMTAQTGLQACEEVALAFYNAFSNLEFTVEDIFAEGDAVSVQVTMTGIHTGDFYGIAPTGKRVKVTEIDIARFDDGKVVEVWGEADVTALATQLGVAR